MSTKVSLEKIKQIAIELNVEPCAIYAVQQVESGSGGAFRSKDGFPVILFEGHKMYSNLKKKGIDPAPYVKSNPSVVYPSWVKTYYNLDQKVRLTEAMNIDAECALKSASWGLFQVMGENYYMGRWPSVFEFVEDMKKSADYHFEAFISFVKYNNLIRYLQSKNWAAFAKSYNGSGYAENQYDTKMANAYNSCVKNNTFGNIVVNNNTNVVSNPDTINTSLYSADMEKWMDRFLSSTHELRDQIQNTNKLA